MGRAKDYKNKEKSENLKKNNSDSKQKFLQFLLIQSIYSLECWTCDSRSLTYCILFGEMRQCHGRNQACFVEQRERKGKLVQIRQGCEQRHSCEIQKRQNFQTRRLTRTNCRPENFLRWPSSVCRQCCYDDGCSATWTPKSRTEWAQNMRDAEPSMSRYEFIFDETNSFGFGK